jgi:hypothetical protein
MKGYFSFIIKLMYLLIAQARLKMMCGSVNAASSRAEKELAGAPTKKPLFK